MSIQATDTGNKGPMTPHHAAIHDPAIALESGNYYIFGTHRDFAISHDLVNWEGLDCNITRDYERLFRDVWQSWPKQPGNPDLKGNMWAPDLIWNPVMHKWCMYMSVNGDHYRSLIVLLTADHLDGDWNLVGPVVYSGFDQETAEATDVPRVLGPEPDLSRYRSLKDTKINAIDAGVGFDEEGRLWMNFGSWFGGIWLLELDPSTGLRRYDRSYPTVGDESDAYYGYKLAGGHWVSGEGSYLLHQGDWWYLFLSYGCLNRTGGYQIRLFRSKKINGPYLDQAGNPAIAIGDLSAVEQDHNWTGEKGIRLLSTCRWPAGPSEDADIEVAQGHNSAFRDSDGCLFMVYHTRFINRGEDDYETRIRQLLPTSDGWLTAAPFEYQGIRSHPGEGGPDQSELIGHWQVVINRKSDYFTGDKTDDQGDYRGVNHAEEMTLTEQGTCIGPVGNRDLTDGTWSYDRETGGISLHLADSTYLGTVTRLPDDRNHDIRICLSAIGSNQSIWAVRTA